MFDREAETYYCLIGATRVTRISASLNGIACTQSLIECTRDMNQ